MKRFSLVLLSALICFSMFSCDDYTHTPSVSSENTSSETVSDTSSQVVTAYNDFLGGKIPAYNNEQEIYITDFENVMLEPGINQYALFDMNNDGIPELHIRAYTYGIFSFENGKIIEVYKEAAGFETHVITKEPALISVHESTGYFYIYTTIDKQNVATSKNFSSYENDFSYLLENPADVVWHSPQK